MLAGEELCISYGERGRLGFVDGDVDEDGEGEGKIAGFEDAFGGLAMGMEEDADDGEEGYGEIAWRAPDMAISRE